MRAWVDRAGWIVAGMLALALIAALPESARGGPLDPAGPPGSTLPLAEPRTPISQLPFTADARGSYFVTADLTVSEGNGITVSASDVTIDLNGFTLRGGDGVSGAGVFVPAALRNLTLKNGVISNFYTGVSAVNAYSSRIERVTVRFHGNYAVHIGASSLVQDCILDGGGTADGGISMSNRTVLRRCIVANHTGFGVQAATYGVIEENQIVDNASEAPHFFGINVTDNDVTIRNNNLDNQTVRDIRLETGKRAVIIGNVLASCDSIAFGGAFVFAPKHGQEHSNVTHSNGYCP